MEKLLHDIGMNIVATLVATPIIALASYLGAQLWHRRRGKRAGQFLNPPPVAWNQVWGELAYLIALAAALVGCAAVSAVVVGWVFDISSETGWTAASVVVAWLLYLVVAAAITFIAQGLLTATKRAEAADVLAATTGIAAHRTRIFMTSVFTKAAFFVLFLAYALIATPGSLEAPLFFGFVFFIAIDIFAAIAMILAD